MLTVSELYIYPIKSLGGIPLDSAALTDRGFAYDRRWMLVDTENRFLTQRELPKMSLLQVQLREDGLLIQHKLLGDSVQVPFKPAGASCTVTVWDDICEAQYVDGTADAWFSRMLSLPCRLVYMPESSQRKVDLNYAQGDEITSFSDGYPLLLIGQASLDDLNSRLPQAIAMERFRPNIVFTGGTPYQEDEMTAFNIAGITFYGVKPCARCVIPTIDLSTGEKGKEPLKTLSGYRQRNKKIYFGQNLLFRNAGGAHISVGDEITLL
jgi:uncharacterized protein YcbX